MENLSLRETLAPGKLEIIGYLLVSLLVFVFINISLIVSRFSDTPLPAEIIESEDYLGSLSFLTQYPIINTVVIVVFWSGVGLLAYTLVWAMINAFIEARNEIVVESEYVNKGRFWERIRPPLVKSAILVLLLGWLVLNFKLILPLLLKNFSQTLVSKQLLNLMWLAAPVLLLAFSLATAAVLLRLFAHPAKVVQMFWPTNATL